MPAARTPDTPGRTPPVVGQHQRAVRPVGADLLEEHPCRPPSSRESGFSELAAALLTLVVFSLGHAMNGLFGQSWTRTAVQLGLTFVGGAAFNVTRMTTGSLVVAMLLHTLWDCGLLGTAATDREVRAPQAVAVAAVYLTGIGALWFVATS